MTASPRPLRVFACLLISLIPLLLTGCNVFSIPDTAPRCPAGYVAPTPAPTPAALPGTVRFGTSINTNLTVHDPQVAFGVHQMVAWIAHFSHPITSGTLRFEIFRSECGRWARVYTGPAIPYGPGQRLHTRGILPALRLEFQIIHLGTYQVRYVNSGSTVARGVFVLH